MLSFHRDDLSGPAVLEARIPMDFPLAHQGRKALYVVDAINMHPDFPCMRPGSSSDSSNAANGEMNFRCEAGQLTVRPAGGRDTN